MPLADFGSLGDILDVVLAFGNGVEDESYPAQIVRLRHITGKHTQVLSSRPAGDDQGRERLVRCCTRPPFALDRIFVLADGRIARTWATMGAALPRSIP